MCRHVAAATLLAAAMGCGGPKPGAEVAPNPEHYAWWNRPDLAVGEASVEPARAEPGQPVTLRVSVENVGTGASGPAMVVFRDGEQEAGRESVSELQPQSGVDLEVPWHASTPGRHAISMSLEHEAGLDGSVDNDQAITILRVRGEDPKPELEFDPPEVVHEPESLRVRVRYSNPGFAAAGDVRLILREDGEEIARVPIDRLDPEGSGWVEFPAARPEPGNHSFEVDVEWPETVPPEDLQLVNRWDVVLPDPDLPHYDTWLVSQWVSLGPKILDNGSTGRMDVVAFLPQDPQRLLAGSPSGGLWTSTSGGGTWQPATDLPSAQVGGVAIDPQLPDVIYVATGNPRFGHSEGIFKSTDGGQTWGLGTPLTDAVQDQAGKAVGIQGAGELILLSPGSPLRVLLAETDAGVVRYEVPSLMGLASIPAEWPVILSGVPIDVAVDPNDDNVVFVSRYRREKGDLVWDGLFRTDKGLTIAKDGDWVRVSTKGSGLPESPDVELTSVEVSPLDSDLVYAAVRRKSWIDLYVSVDGGFHWKRKASMRDDFVDFVRVDPADPCTVFMGGVDLWRVGPGGACKAPLLGWLFGPSGLVSWSGSKVSGVHADMKELRFLPPSKLSSKALNAFYVTNDGGVWYCETRKVGGPLGGSSTYVRCEPRNENLRTLQFFAGDAAKVAPQRLLGGTQDNGTVLYEGQAMWREIRGGDGNYALIGPGAKPVMFGQQQCLNDDWGTQRSTDGGKSWHDAKSRLPKDWCFGNGQIVLDPGNADELLAQGDEVYHTSNGGQAWHPVGPTRTDGRRGYVRRVAIQPQTGHWVAGTSLGQVWLNDGNWRPLLQQLDDQAVSSLTFAPTNHQILYATFGFAGRGKYRIYRFDLASGAGGSITYDFPGNEAPRVIAGDGHHDDIAFVGTEHSIYRWDGANHWQRYSNGLPFVEVKDLFVDPVTRELVLLTWGRGAWGVVTGP